MRALIILILTVASFWLISVQWGILAFATGAGAVTLIATDKRGSIDTFFSYGFALILVGGAVAFFKQMLGL